MLCRRRRPQGAGCPLVDIRGRAIIGNKPRKNPPSFNLVFALAALLVDWSASHGHSRVFNSKNSDRSVE